MVDPVFLSGERLEQRPIEVNSGRVRTSNRPFLGDTWEHIVPMLGAGSDRRYFFHVHDGLPANRPSPKWGQIGPSS